MKEATITLKSLTPLSFGKFHQTEKLPKENPADFEERTWREKAHYTQDNKVKIPGFMLAGSIRESAKYLSLQIPGKGKSTYTKHFDAGVSILDDIVLPVTKEMIKRTSVHVPSDGRAGGTTRVIKIFPIIHEWQGGVKVIIGDDIITPDVFEKVVRNAGMLIGIGTWRPRNRGLNGRFDVTNIEWKDYNS